MSKLVVGILCSTMVFTGIALAAAHNTSDAELVTFNGRDVVQVMYDKPIAIEGSIELPKGKLKNSDQKPHMPNTDSLDQQRSAFQTLPITQTNKGVEVTVQAVRLTKDHTDFEITVNNKTDKEEVKLYLAGTKAGANHGIKGKTYETVVAASHNPDFKDAVIKPGKERHGWLYNKALTDKDVQNLTLRLSVHGKEGKREFLFKVDCKDLKFRTL
ncbi:hypothetical protein [Paenibacillus sp. UMB4589-SE434]|uniref:hypothetical protein n=1 Tax=Paenibacillus sp. UMB4589-SE434 TaxID=3046314 RepID=UPI002551165E|nr:hypothetical protein [Paenibacillus sp. UMB4589-SE434]MDK8183878.1 hypothetical protein [Paenibacillus sp. UMB4589-SE434]